MCTGGGVEAALVEQRHFDVLHHRVLLNQVVRLEDETDPRGPNPGELIVVHAGDVVAAEVIAAVAGAIEAAQQVEQRALAGAGRPHDGDVIPLRHVERHAAQGADGFALEDVILANVDELSRQLHGVHSICPFPD